MAKPKPFKPSVSAETAFSRALRKVARHSGHIVEAHVSHAGLTDEPGMQRALLDYSKLIGPWAKKQSQKMLEQVSKANRRAYQARALTIAQKLKLQVAEREVGLVASRMVYEQVELIQSLPLRAGLRAQKLALNAVYSGGRASEVAKAIEDLRGAEDVSQSDAMRIARTEIARANAALTQARAEAVGAQSYIWRTTMDGAERKSHREMNGKTILYSEVPTLSDGTSGHAGALIQCRCWQSVVFDD